MKKQVTVKRLNSAPDYWKSFQGETGVIVKRGNADKKGKYPTRYLVKFTLERWFRKDDLIAK